MKKQTKSIEEIEELVKNYLDEYPKIFYTPAQLELELELNRPTEKKRLRSVLNNFCTNQNSDFPYKLTHQFRPEHGYFRSLQIEGIYKQTAQKYGRVFPDDENLKRGIRVFNQYNQGAEDGDTVLIDVKQLFPIQKSYASVIKILNKAQNKIQGVLYNDRIHSYGLKVNKSYKAVNSDNYQNFDVVLVSPQDKQARIEELIYHLDFNDIRILQILNERNIPVCFNYESIKESNACLISESDYLNREDLREENTLTIDPSDAKDFDDAISIIKTQEKITVKVHIADVTHFVSPDSSLDVDAQNRVETIYTPEGSIPLLPRKLAEDLCSLVPYEDRLALTCELTFDKHFELQNYRFYSSIIQNKNRLTYQEADLFLNIDETSSLNSDLKLLSEIAQKLKKDRINKGAIIFDIPSLKIYYDNDNLIFENKSNEDSLASQLIEEFMILTNHCAAQFIKEKFEKNKGFYRNHDLPDLEKLNDLNIWLVYDKNEKSVNQNNFKKRFNELKNKPFYQEMFLRGMSRAEYSPQAKSHFALGLSPYTHFTSPIRRYSDIIVHRLIKKALGYNIKIPSKSKLESLCSKLNNRTIKIEKSTYAIQRPYHGLMAQQMKEEKFDRIYKGIVTSVMPYGVFVRLENGVEGLMHISNFDDLHSPFSNRKNYKDYIEGDVIPVRIAFISENKVSFKHRDLNYKTYENYEKYEEELRRERLEYLRERCPDFDFDDDY